MAKLSPKIVAAKKNGRKGGNASAEKMTTEQKRDRARKAGSSTLTRYGNSYFAYIRSKRKHYPKTLKRRKHDDKKDEK